MKRDSSDKAFNAFVERHAAPDEIPSDLAVGPREQDDPLVHELLLACLSWNAPRAGVASAIGRIHETLVDYNELRVMLPEDAADLLGARYPKAAERCARLRSALHEVFQRENGLTLAHLRDENKREAKAYLESLPGLPVYAANRVALVGCGVHAFPVDPVIHALFDNAGVLDEDTDEQGLAGRLERAVRAGDALGRFWAFEVASRDGAPKTSKSATSRQGATKKTASKKPAQKKTASKRGKKTV